MQQTPPGGIPNSDQPDQDSQPHPDSDSHANSASPSQPDQPAGAPEPTPDSSVAGNVADTTPPPPASDFLGNSPEPTPPPTAGGGLNPKLLVGLGTVVVLGLAAAAAIYFLGQSDSEPTAVITPSLQSPSPSPTSSLKPGEQVALLKPVSGYDGSGEVARSATPERFVLTVSAQLPDPAAGGFYEVWLVRRTPFAQFSVGKLQKEGNRWVVTLDQPRDASDYQDVMVTLERTDDKQPETRVLTGSF